MSEASDHDVDAATPDRGATTVAGGLMLALRFLLPLKESGSNDPSAWRRARYWFLPIGLAIGLAWAGAFRGVWRVYGEEVTSLRLVPAAAVLMVDILLLLGYSLFAGLAATVNELAEPRTRLESHEQAPPALRTPAVLVLLVALVLELVFVSALRTGSYWWPSDWRRFLNFAYPNLIYRPLILAPIWGRWAVLLASSVGRVAPRASAEAGGLSKAVGPRFVLVSFLFPLGLTAVYCSRERNLVIGVIISLVVLATTFGLSVFIARRGGGQTRRSMLAAGKVAELVFLGAFVALSGTIRGW